MSRAERLLELAQALRRRRAPVAGQTLASELGVSLRTLYRDIDALRAQGAPIEGEAGLGYVLRPGFTLPPLMFGAGEIDALTLGLRWAARQGDPGLAVSARDALAKISAVLPPRLGEAIETSPLIPVGRAPRDPSLHLPVLRQAIADHRKVGLDYVDVRGDRTRRTVWPVCIGFFEETLMLAAWCEMRVDFRHFRLDRIDAARPAETPIPKPRRALMRAWREATCIENAADGI